MEKSPKNKAGYFLGVNVALGGVPLGSHEIHEDGWVV